MHRSRMAAGWLGLAALAMTSAAVAEPKTELEPADATVLGEDMAAPPASLADIPLSRGRTAIEICDKPGEITLLLQLGRGRTPPRSR